MGSLGSGIMGAKTTSNAAVGLEVAITNLQDYCNGSKSPKSPTIIMIIIILHYHLL
jgi:hypothetical protein